MRRSVFGLSTVLGLTALCLATAFAAEAPSAAAPSAAAPLGATSPRLYALDCGAIRVGDMAGFSDLGEQEGQVKDFVVPCFVIAHPKGILVWDAGLNDGLAAQKDGVDHGVFHLAVKTTLAAQLKTMGLAPSDVTYLAFSHMHFDHTGNAGLFTASTIWLMNRTELAWALSDPTPFGVGAENLAAAKTVKSELFVGDRDVFGDGSVRILSAPGHTPGSAVLMLQLKKAGTVILSGDLYHTLHNLEKHRVPSFNTSRAETVASFDRVDSIVRNKKARLVVQHSPEHFAKLPKFPAYLE